MSTADGSVVGTTKIVDNGPSSGLWNLVVMSDGYQSGQLGQFASDAQSFVDRLFATSPLDDAALGSVINVYRVDVTSTDSGADDPQACGGTGATARTYFDASFCFNGPQKQLALPEQRALGVNQLTALKVAGAQVPNWSVIMVIVNPHPRWLGRFGRCLLARDGRSRQPRQRGWHARVGPHRFPTRRRVRDPRTPRGPSDFNLNMSGTANRAQIAWRDLIDATTALPTTSNADCTQPDPQPNPVGGTVGAFEGGNYMHCGAYRSQFNCRMRELGQPFCEVCQRVIHDVLAQFNSKLDLVVAGFGYNAGAGAPSVTRGSWPTPPATGARTSSGSATTACGSRGPAGRPIHQIHGARARGRQLRLCRCGGGGVERHPRFMADTTGDGRADIVGFGNDGVWVSRGQLDGSFSASERVVAAFGSNAGGWRVERHPRFMADTTNDRRADIVGFGNAGVWVSRAQPDGTFSAPQRVVAAFGYDAGWRVERHPRFMADTTGDGRADIVGFFDDGVWVSRAQPDGSFSAPSASSRPSAPTRGLARGASPAVHGRDHPRRPGGHRRVLRRRRVGLPRPAGRQLLGARARRRRLRTVELTPMDCRAHPTHGHRPHRRRTRRHHRVRRSRRLRLPRPGERQLLPTLRRRERLRFHLGWLDRRTSPAAGRRHHR